MGKIPSLNPEQQQSSQQQSNKQKPIQKSQKKPKPNEKPFNTPSQIESIFLIDEPRPKPQIRQFVYMPNVEFYLNKMSSHPNGTFIDNMHKTWWGNYILLQTNHNYIQWLFPNSFQSRFNQKAKPLTKEEAKHFRENLTIATRYVHSYEMILEFFGMRLQNRITGEIARTIKPRFKDRYDETLLSAYHNHLRVTRILCSLTEVGFAFYAREWCKFLKKQIYQHNGRLIRLKHMDVYKHWRPYQGDSKERSNKIDVQDTPNIYLRTLWKQEGYNPLVKERSKWTQVHTKNKVMIVLEDGSDDDDNNGKHQKNEAKLQQQNPGKSQQIQQKHQHQNQTQELSLREKLQHEAQPQISDSQEQFSLSSEDSDLIPEKQYGRRGSKQYQQLKKQLSTSEYAVQKERILKQMKRQQEREKNIEQKIISYLKSDGDNPIKQRMVALRKKYDEKLKEFSGPRRAETMEEREQRMMDRGGKYILEEDDQSEVSQF